VSDSVCQGFPVYGIRYFGGLQPATLANIYEESTGSSTNPMYGYPAQMGMVVQGGTGTRIVGNFPVSGYAPVFATGGGTAAERNYFVVPRSSNQGYGPVLYIGSAEPANGSVSIPLVWPSVALQNGAWQSVGTLTWDILVTTGSGAQPPNGTGNYMIASNASGSCGTNGMCSFSDTQAAATSYTVNTQGFVPVFWFWPANVAINNTAVIMDDVAAAPGAVASQGILGVSIAANQCKSLGAARQRSPIWISCLTTENSYGAATFGTVLQEQDQANNGPAANSKGRLNFGKPIGAPNDLLTLQDSNFAKTMVSSGHRPSNDAGDMALGVDQGGGMTQRAATSISSYINTLPSGANYQERLTAAAKTFNVPVTVNGNFSVPTGTVTLPVTGSGTQCLHVSSTGVLSGTGADCGSGSGTGAVTVNTGVTSQIALYSGNGTALGGDSALIDNGTTLNYTGPGGITAGSATFSGNLTVNGQLLVAGPWMVSSPVPGTAMAAAGTGSSSLGISNDGNFYISANAGAPSRVLTAGSDAVPTVFGRAGAVTAASGDYTCAQVTGCTPNTTTVNGHPLTGNVTVSTSDLTLGALANGTTATTQTPGDSSTKLATTAFATANFAAMNVSGAVGDIPKISGNSPTPAITDSGVLAGPYTVPWITAVRSGGTATFSQNVVKMWGIVLTYPLLTSSVVYSVTSADTGGNSYDIGIACGQTSCGSYSAGQIMLDVGATAASTFAGTTGGKTLNWTQGTKTMQPGKYYLVFTTNCASSCASLAAGGSSADITFQNGTTAGTTSGGALANFTAPSDLWSWGANLPAVIVK